MAGYPVRKGQSGGNRNDFATLRPLAREAHVADGSCVTSIAGPNAAGRDTPEAGELLDERAKAHPQSQPQDAVKRRKSKDQTYYAKKMLIYYEANRQGVHTRELGIANFRVATVTTTRDRVEQMIAAQREFTNGRGSNMFLFADEATFAAGNPLDIEWVSGKGERVRITD
jgi:hypothetical protein